MSGIRSFNTFPDSAQQSLEAKLELYTETVSILQIANSKLTKENNELFKEIEKKDEEIMRLQQSIYRIDKGSYHISQNASVFQSFIESKSDLMGIIESFQSANTTKANLEELQCEFDDIEKIQNSMKSENVSLKKSLEKFEELYPSMYKICNLTQQLFRAIQSYIEGGSINLSFLVSSPEKKYKTHSLLEHFRQDINKTREVLEKIIEILADYYAEKLGSGSCSLF